MPKMAPRIEAQEIETYWNIFSDRSGGGKYLTGEQAAPVLKNSGLREEQLAQVWDLADIDGDGNLDFEEFCVAMRIIFDIINKEYSDVPKTLPDWLVPESKAHLVQAAKTFTGKEEEEEGEEEAYQRVEDDLDSPSLKDGFDWYMPPADKAKYEQIYQENRDMGGEITFGSLQDLYETLDLPDTDIRSAWNLINPSARPSVNKDAALAFLHMLNNRHDGYRIPRSVPASLRSSFERNQINYSVDSQRTPSAASSRWAVRADDETATGRKAKFGDQYLTRLGRSGFKTAGTDFSTEKSDAGWEEVRLKKQLQELEEKVARVEADVKQRQSGKAGVKTALIKKELEQLLDYKRSRLRELENGTAKGGADGATKDIQEDLHIMDNQVRDLEAHLRSREARLDRLRKEIGDMKAGRSSRWPQDAD